MEINWEANREVSGYLHLAADGYGFLRPTVEAAAAQNDIYVSPSHIRRFDLQTGAHITGLARPPRAEEVYHALLKIDQITD